MSKHYTTLLYMSQVDKVYMHAFLLPNNNQTLYMYIELVLIAIWPL